MNEAALAALCTGGAVRQAGHRGRVAVHCRAMDRIDDALTAAMWRRGSKCNYASTASQPDILFRDYLTAGAKARAGLANHSHHIANTIINVNGDRAVSEACFTAAVQTHPVDGTVTERVWRGRYLDRWSRLDGVRAIDHQQVLFDSYTPHEFSAALLDGKPLALSQRDQDNPSYSHLASLD